MRARHLGTLCDLTHVVQEKFRELLPLRKRPVTGALHLTWRIQMFRKISFAVVTAIALGAAAMTPAAAGGGHGGHHGGKHGHGHHAHRSFFGSSAFYIGGDCYRYIQTRRGIRLVNVCVY